MVDNALDGRAVDGAVDRSRTANVGLDGGAKNAKPQPNLVVDGNLLGRCSVGTAVGGEGLDDGSSGVGRGRVTAMSVVPGTWKSAENLLQAHGEHELGLCVATEVGAGHLTTAKVVAIVLESRGNLLKVCVEPVGIRHADCQFIIHRHCLHVLTQHSG